MAKRQVGLAVFAGFLSVLGLSCILPSPPPSDADLVLQFTRDSASYQRVVTMLAADTNIGTISSKFVWRVGQHSGDASAAQVGITEPRLVEYRRILDSLGVIDVTRWARDEVMFLTWSRGFGGNTHHRGIAWLSKPTSNPAWMRFRVIKAPWHMFED